MTGWGLDAELLAFVAKSESFYPASANHLSPAENRATYDRMCAAFDRPYPPGLAVSDSSLAATGPDRRLALREYRPSGAPDGRAVLYFHGGGFVLGGLASHDGICADLASLSGRRLLALDYRLAPEHPYPAALDDAEAAFLALQRDHPHLVVAGDSAGGGLAASLCQRLRRRGGPMPAGQVLIYPGLHPDPARAAGSWRAEAPMLRSADVVAYRRLYTGASAVPTADPELAPLAASDFRGLPPAALFAADIDPLAEDCADYAAALQQAGVAVSHDPGRGLVHGHLRGRHESRAIAAVFTAIAEALRRLC